MGISEVEMGRLIEPAPELVTETMSVGTRKRIIERFKASQAPFDKT